MPDEPDNSTNKLGTTADSSTNSGASRAATTRQTDRGEVNPSAAQSLPLGSRFRTYLPVVVDLETGGFNANTDAILELAAVILRQDAATKQLEVAQTFFHRITPFAGANIEPDSLEFTGINPYHPLRIAKPEKPVLQNLFKLVRQAIRANECTRAILVAHNAHFDHGFIKAACARHQLKRSPFHPFSSFDTASLSGLAYGQTVLAKACEVAGLGFDSDQAHSARYDARKTAELFCTIVNRWQELGGWPPE